jgi:putative transposase
VRSPETNGVVERFFGTLKDEHRSRATIGDGNALAVEVNLFRHTYDTLRPTRPSTNPHHARLASPSNTAMSVWPLADPLVDWEVLT